MRRTHYIFIVLATTMLSGCLTQPPADIVRGSGMSEYAPAFESAKSAPALGYTGAQAEDLHTAYQSHNTRLGEQTLSKDGTTIAWKVAQKVTGKKEAPQPSMNTYIVQKGDTLYSLSRRFNISVKDILTANNLDAPTTMYPGDILMIPIEGAATTTAAQAVKQPENKPYRLTRARFEKPVQLTENTLSVKDRFSIEPAARSASLKSDTVSYVTHRVQRGETVYRISKNYNTTVFDVLSVNNLDSPQALKAGTTIRVPVTGAEQPATRQINQTLARAKGMVWPARGKILKSFGQKGNGVTHTGINIQLPENTAVVAAENGTVIYADNALKSYGNLVLLRHKDGLVTAYAHNNRLQVTKNQKVKKGQTIALSGATGNVKNPQLHFEVRRNARAINPTKVLPK